MNIISKHIQYAYYSDARYGPAEDWLTIRRSSPPFLWERIPSVHTVTRHLPVEYSTESLVDFLPSGCDQDSGSLVHTVTRHAHSEVPPPPSPVRGPTGRDLPVVARPTLRGLRAGCFLKRKVPHSPRVGFKPTARRSSQLSAISSHNGPLPVIPVSQQKREDVSFSSVR